MPSVVENEKSGGRGAETAGYGMRAPNGAAALAVPVASLAVPVLDPSSARQHPAAQPVLEPLPPGSLPHVGIIMDGNGRWAAARGLPRIEGHRRGLDALRGTVRAAIELKLAYLTVYSFSAENWSRPLEEIRDLMGLLKRFIRKDLIDLHKSGVRVKVIGDRANLQPDIRALLVEAETVTRDNTGLTLVVAFNYGGRQEITAAVRDIARKLAQGLIQAGEIDETMLSRHLDTAGIPDPDLIIRTSGEQRLSNFLLWQAAYSEFVFLPVLWPDFDREAFTSALSEFAARERRFGGVTAPAAVRTGS